VECPDLVAESQLLALAGVNLGSDTVYLLQVALRNLIKEKSLVDARFFGKVFGTQKDYFVIEAKADGSGDDAAPGSDAPGTGVNALAFFVAHTAAGPWTRLPDIGAQHIVNARAIKRVFTGNLDAPIGGYPSLALIAKRAPPPPHGSGVANDEAAAAAAADIAAFNKVNTERYLLRAQLARIAAATVVAPNNAWEKKDGEDSFSKVAAPAAIDPSQYTDLSKWLHARTHIYPNGRTKIADAENPDVDTGGVAPFRAVTESNAEKPHWIVRLTANQGLDLHPGVMCKSLTWPGAVAVAKGTHHACIYIGQGVRHSSTLFTPPAPPAIQAEYTADAAYAYKPKVDGEEAPAVAPRPPMFFAQDVSFDPRPPAPVAEEAPAE
jgi:radial spoke head protein 4A